MTTIQPSAVVFDNVSVTREGVRILESVTASVPHGSATAIIGPNGAGKTTLLLTLLDQIEFKGRITVHGTNGHSDVRIGYVPQRLDFDRGMPITAMDLMVMGHQRLPLWLGTRRIRRHQAMDMLQAVRAEHLASRRLGSLSGGELQRVLLALAIQQEPDILILDEPASGIDIGGEHLLCELLESLRRERNFTQIMVTHDLSLVTAHSTHVICLNRRVLGQGPTHTTLSAEVLAATFGIHLGLANIHAVTHDGVVEICSQDHHHDGPHVSL